MARQIHDRGSRFLMIAASLVLVVAGLKAIKAVALPLLLAIFLSLLSAPLLTWLTRRRVPKLIAVAVTVLANVSVLAVFLLLIGSSISEFARSVPEYQARIETKLEHAFDWLEERGIDTSELGWLQNRESLTEEILGETPEGAPPAPPGRDEAGRDEPQLINLAAFLDLIGSTLRGIASILSMTLLVLLLMVFILIEASYLPQKLKAAFGWSDEDLVHFTGEFQRYLIIKTLISLATGLLVGVGVALLGVQYPLLWGMTAFVFNYIPSIGSIIAAVPPVLLTWIDLGLGRALLVALVYLAVNITFGNVLEPHLMGRRFGISTLVVILSLIFWGWLWGPVGMLLSVPLTIVVKIMMQNTEDFRWLAQLMGGKPRTPLAAAATAAASPASSSPAIGQPLEERREMG